MLFSLSENVHDAEAIQLTDGRMAIQISAGNWYTIETLWTAFAIPAFVDQQKITEMVASFDWRPASLLSGTN